MDIQGLRQWIGKQESRTDYLNEAPINGLAALLDYEQLPWGAGELPPLAHWLYFLPQAQQSHLDRDGHPHRGGLLPPVPLPRRMWAGGKLAFHAPLRLDTRVQRISTIGDVVAKSGSSGDMVFVTVDHRIVDEAGNLCVQERQDIVYRGESGPTPQPQTRKEAAPASPLSPSGASRTIVPDPALLFRFSALTFNAHRIHYDRDYARDVEGYPGLVVHGPLSATLLMDHFLRQAPAAGVTGFEFRARRPLFDTEAFQLHYEPAQGGASLWTSGPDGQPAMTATIEARR